MKIENTASRLKKIMSMHNLRQVDILEAAQPYCKKYGIKLNKSDLSQYISGIVEPGSYKLTILSLALNVSEPWLMGFDVPMQDGIDGPTNINSLPPNNAQDFITLTPDPTPQTQTLLVFNKNGKAGAYEKVIPSDDVLNEINKLAQALKPYPAEQINALLKLVESGGNIPIKADMPPDLKELIATAANLSEENRKTLIQVAKSMK